MTIALVTFIIINERRRLFMNKKSIDVLPETQLILGELGERIKMARLRRQMSVEDVAERSGISRTTLWAIEKGSPSVAIGAYASVLHTLDKMDADLINIAKDELLSKKIQGISVNSKIRKMKQ